MIEFENVTFVYKNGVRALEDISITFHEGEFVFLVGPTGCGKSTLLKLIYRECVPTAGKVFVLDREASRLKKKHVPYLRRHVGVVFQEFELLPYKTVYENVAFALEVINTPRPEIDKRVLTALKMVNLLDKSDSFPGDLSGGEKQRTSVARAIINRPPILVADEPTGNLDPDASRDIVQLLMEINLRQTTVIMATHDRQIVDEHQRRVVQMTKARIISDERRGTYPEHG